MCSRKLSEKSITNWLELIFDGEKKHEKNKTLPKFNVAPEKLPSQ